MKAPCSLASTLKPDVQDRGKSGPALPRLQNEKGDQGIKQQAADYERPRRIPFSVGHLGQKEF